jgi:plastocyanin
MALLAVFSAALVVVTVAGCSGGGSGAAAGGATVIEKNFAFTPNTLAVNVGDTVTFMNQDAAPHEVSINNQDLGKQSPGQNVTWKASSAGTYPFRCLIHATMTGQVTVGSGGASAPPASGSGSGSPSPGGGTGGGYTPPSGGAGY